MKVPKLSNKERDVMLVFWNSADSLAASDIPKINDALNINTVRAAIKNLLKKSCIEADEIVQRGTVLTHTYRPTFSFEDYLGTQLSHMHFNSLNLISTLIRREKNDENLDELEEIIRQHRNSMK